MTAFATHGDQPFGMFSVDARLLVRTWDPWMAAVTGVPAEHALGRPVADVLPGADAERVAALLRDVLNRGTVEVLSAALHHYLFACPPQTPSARFDRMQQHVTAGPIREEGRISGVVVTIEDVTPRIERERAVPDLAGALGHTDWSARQREVRALARHADVIVDGLVRTLRDQHRNFNILSSALDLLAMTDVDVVEPLIGFLDSEDPDLRVQAALILGQRRDPRAAPALMRALLGADVNVRFHAIEALGRLRATDATDELLRIVETREFFLAFPAIQALARVGDAHVAHRLVPLLQDDMLRDAAVDAVGELGDDVVVPPLVALLSVPHAPADSIADALMALFDRYEQRYHAGEQIATIVRREITPDGSRNLLDAAQRVASDRLRGIAGVLGWLEGPAVERALTRMLGQPGVRAQVVEALVRYGPGVVDLLIEQLQAEDLETRQAAAVALGRIGDRRATLALARALEDPEMALPAAAALAAIGDAAAFEPLLRRIADPDGAVRQASIAALNSISHPDMPARIPALLQDPDPLVRESALKIAGYFGYRECLPLVLGLCADPGEAVRRAAVEQLPMFEQRQATERLAEALASDTPAVRAVAASALGHADAADAIGPLVRALDDEDAWVRYFALRSLGMFHGAPVVAAVRARLEHDPAPQVRLAALDVLGRLQPADILTVLTPLALSEDADTARGAIRAMRHVGTPDIEPTLDALSRAAEEWRRLEAVTAIGQRGGSYAVGALQWVAAADDVQSVADAAIAGLAGMAQRDERAGGDAVEALIGLTAEPSRREAAIAALGRLPVSRAPELARGLQHPAPSVRRAVVEALSRMRHTDASRWIEAALDDSAATVRAAAVAELRRLGTGRASRKLVILAQSDPDASVRHAATIAGGAGNRDTTR